MSVDLRIRAGTCVDAPTAAALHATEIGGGFLASLGQPFLARLYRRVVRAEDAFLLIAEDGRRPLGFAAVAEDTRRFYRTFLLRDGIQAGLIATPKLVASLSQVLETLRYGTAKTLNPAPPQLPVSSDHEKRLAGIRAEVLAVAVAPDARGRGVGSALVRSAIAELTRRGIPAARVVAERDNTAAVALYQSCGFQPTALTEIHRGQISQVLTWS